VNRYLRAAMNMPAQLPEDEAEARPVPAPYSLLSGTGTDVPGYVVGGGPWGRLVRAWERAEPPPRAWVLPGRVPAGATTILYGDAGTLKTWAALHVAVCIAMGAPWLGQPVTQQPVVYVDIELDEEEFLRRAYPLARGLGRPGVPEGLHYLQLKSSLGDPATIPAIAPWLAEVQAGLVVLDSLSVACFGSDLERPATMTDVMQQLRAWGTVLALDHIPKPLPGTNQSHLRPFGSQFKYAIARSVLQMHTAESGQALIIRQVKSNFGPRQDPLGLRITFSGVERVTVEGLPLDSPELAGLDENLPVSEQVARALGEQPTGATPVELAAELGMSVKTVRNHLTSLRHQNRAAPLGDGRWQPLGGSRPAEQAIGSGNGTPPATRAEPAIPCHDCGAPLPEGYWHECPACLARAHQN
jgi:hypothetical protein